MHPTSAAAPRQVTPTVCARCGYPLQRTALSHGRSVCPECGLGTSGPLSGDDFAQIDAAQKRGRKIRKAAGVATFSAWTSGFFAGSALLFAWVDKLMGGGVDVVSLAIGAALTVVTINEFRGAAKLRRFDPSGPKLLGCNQLLLLASITAYCIWNMFFAPSTLAHGSGDPEVDRVMADFSGLETTVRFGVYGAVILGSVLAQGLTALYYFGRTKHLRAYLDQTPPWVIELQRRNP